MAEWVKNSIYKYFEGFIENGLGSGCYNGTNGNRLLYIHVDIKYK